MKRVAKSDLPTKICAVCGRPFTWRKKWRAVWDRQTGADINGGVRYCSEACRRKRGPGLEPARACLLTAPSCPTPPA